MDIKMIFHQALSLGMLGENIVSDDNRVWITKSHYPKGMPGARSHAVNKMIVIARNPIDIVPSFAGLVQTDSHSLVPEQ